MFTVCSCGALRHDARSLRARQRAFLLGPPAVFCVTTVLLDPRVAVGASFVDQLHELSRVGLLTFVVACKLVHARVKRNTRIHMTSIIVCIVVRKEHTHDMHHYYATGVIHLDADTEVDSPNRRDLP